MGTNLEISDKLQQYIDNFSLKLNPIQQEIIDHNNTLGDIKRMHSLNVTKCIVMIYYFLLDRIKL